MRDFSTSFDVYSPRWGHPDRYSITFSSEQMQINQGSFSAICVLNENGDPEWSGYENGIGNPLMNIFSNDSIYAPEIVPFALECAWEKWRNGSVEESELQNGLEELFSWIDQTAISKPSSKLWNGAF